MTEADPTDHVHLIHPSRSVFIWCNRDVHGRFQLPRRAYARVVSEEADFQIDIAFAGALICNFAQAGMGKGNLKRRLVNCLGPPRRDVDIRLTSKLLI